MAELEFKSKLAKPTQNPYLEITKCIILYQQVIWLGFQLKSLKTPIKKHLETNWDVRISIHTMYQIYEERNNMISMETPCKLILEMYFTIIQKYRRRKWQPTPVFLPGESQGRGSLVGCRLWGCTELDMTEVT